MAVLVNKKHVFCKIYNFGKHFQTKEQVIRLSARSYVKGLRRIPRNVYTADEAEALQNQKFRPWTRRSPASDTKFAVEHDIPDDVNFEESPADNSPWSRRARKHKGDINATGKTGRRYQSFSEKRVPEHNEDYTTEETESVLKDSFGWIDSEIDSFESDTTTGKERQKITGLKPADEEIDSESGGKNAPVTPSYRYVLLDKGDKRFTSAVIQAKGGQGKREKHGTILIEGTKLVNDAFAVGVKIKMIFFDTVAALNKLKLGDENNIPVFKVKSSRMKLLSQLTNPPGIMAVAEMPKFKKRKRNTSPMIMILDSIKDPGDMGTLIRTAGVAGCKLVLVTKGCVDVWNAKVLRSGAGAHFSVPIVDNVTWPYVCNYLPEQTFVALIHRYDERFNRRVSALRDIGLDTRRGGEDKYVYVRKARKTISGKDKSYDKDSVELYERIPLPRVSLFDVDIGHHKHVTCVISGEYEGASGAARKLVVDYRGKEVYIPNSDKTIPDINAAVSGCVVLTEAKRQLYNKGLIQDTEDGEDNEKSEEISDDSDVEHLQEELNQPA